MHKQKGVLLVNLGSPDSTNIDDVKKYLREFLMDGMVLDMPYLVRKYVVECHILPTRPQNSATAYKKIWTEEGSPLVVISKKVQQALQKQIDIPVALGMRYGSLSIKKALDELYEQGVKDVFVIPLYPQYTMSSTGTVIAKTLELQKKYFADMQLIFLDSFYQNAEYITVLADHIKESLPQDIDRILFSYHGISERHETKTFQKKYNPLNIQDMTYREQCFKTTELVRGKLGLPQEKVSVSFQSRLGKYPWIKPYTDMVLDEFSSQGVKKIAVVAPAFVSDCLETLEEIDMSYREQFIEAGGEEFVYIPCLNTSPKWVELLTSWIDSHFVVDIYFIILLICSSNYIILHLA